MYYKKSKFNVSIDMQKYRSENHIDLAVQILDLLKGKTVSQIKDICLAAKIIAQENAKLP